MYRRNITDPALAALADNPVVFLNGARQTGKTTFVQWLAAEHRPARYLSLDDAGVLAAASTDPVAFLGGIDGAATIDEVQKAPALLPAIKLLVDRDRRPGRFLLTGSADVLALPRVSESLAGRTEVLTLWPLAQREIERSGACFVDTLFAKAPPRPHPTGVSRADLVRRILRGGYPEVVARRDADRRGAWFGSYLTTILQRDVRDIANIAGLTELPRLLALLATRSASLLNLSEVSRSLAMPLATLRRYLALLELTFLIQLVPPWSSSLGKRLVKSPKVYVSDAGLAGHLMGIDDERMDRDGSILGPLLESFVAMEIRKELGWSRTRARMFHFRTLAGREVDLVLEDAAGRIVGLEVKSRSTPEERDFAGLKALAGLVGKQFHRGVVLYAGQEPLTFGPGLHALPVSALWSD